MKLVSFLLLLVLTLGACTQEDQSRPEDILPKEKMALILSDVHLAEGIISAKEFSKDSSLLLFTELEDQLLAKHGVTPQQFRDSYNWYTSHVVEYKELYTIIVDTLNVRTSEGKME